MSIWLTVEDLAKYLKVSKILIYQWLQQNKIPATKMGRMWRFNQQIIDQWLLSNQTKSISSSFSKDKNILDKPLQYFFKLLKKNFDSCLKQVVLYGSWARGDQTKGSDVDLLVVMDPISNFSVDYQKIINLAYQATFGQNNPLVFSVTLMREKDYLMGQSSFLLNIRKEGKRAA